MTQCSFCCPSLPLFIKSVGHIVPKVNIESSLKIRYPMLDTQNTQYWPRLIALVDMNALFASIEQQDHPEYRDKPIGITNGKTGICLINCSYEARVFSIHMGMRLKEALRRCPDFMHIPARPECYAAVSSAIIEALQSLA